MYDSATAEQIEFFREHGWLVVEDAIAQGELDIIQAHCQQLLDDKQRYAQDWAWDQQESLEERSYRIVQSFPHFTIGDCSSTAYRDWLVAFADDLMGMTVHFWYDQFLAKPPKNSSPTYWHQDEAYWGRNLRDKGITCWIPLQDVSPENGCMHFIDHGHADGILNHHLVEGVKSDLLTCDVDEARVVVCPVRRGSVTFHHSKTPHMTTANVSKKWRKALTNHMKADGVERDGDHYPWRVLVNPFTGERSIPESRPVGPDDRA
jgi:ectoine hydroxylase-related dioxygenase (phytanoyl-CoA dioxygenase family)